MQIDMKDSIAQAAKNLVINKGVKKLTVKDIVDECHITRQAFYYHFEDIPALFRWILDRNSTQILTEAQTMKNGEEKQMGKKNFVICFYLQSIVFLI